MFRCFPGAQAAQQAIPKITPDGSESRDFVIYCGQVFAEQFLPGRMIRPDNTLH
jgi:hypothetical protein